MRARELAERLNLTRHGREWRGSCPACGYGADAFKIEEKEGRAVWWCASCQDRASLTRAVQAVAGGGWHPTIPSTRSAPTGASEAERSRRAAAIWDAALPLPGTLAAAYLAHRQVLAPLDAFDPHPSGVTLRYLPRCWCSEVNRELPAMLAAVRDPVTGELRAVHRTFLAEPGRKAALTAPKKSFGPIGGAAVLLHAVQPDRPLVVAEGIETAAAASALLGAPAWAAVSAGNIPALRLPDHAQDIIIAADPGRAGEAAADAAAQRWRAEGRRVRIAMPDDATADFADLLIRRAERDNPNA